MLLKNTEFPKILNFLVHKKEKVARKVFESDKKNKNHILIGKIDLVYISLAYFTPKWIKQRIFYKLSSKYRKREN
jgi:short-subunit dehydrogenase